MAIVQFIFLIGSVAFIPYSLSSEASWTSSLTAIVFEGSIDCYYIPDIKTSKEIAIEYRVTNTKSVWTDGNINIGFKVFDSYDKPLISDDDASTGSYFLTSGTDGDHKVCLDNRSVSSGDKAVYLKLEVANSLKRLRKLIDDGIATADSSGNTYEPQETKIENDDHESFIMEGGDDLLETFGYKAAEIRTQLQNIHENIQTASSIHQTVYQRTLASSHIAYNCLKNVDIWSTIHLIILVLIGFIQAFVMKKLFDDKSIL